MTDPSDSIEDTAALWILRQDRGELTAEQWAELEQWLARDSHHRAAYLRLERAWRVSGNLSAWRAHDGRIDPDVLARDRQQLPHQKDWGRRALAMAAMFVVAIAPLLYWRTVEYPQAQLYSTQVGGYQRLVLPDESIIQLNTDTQVSIRVTRSSRTVDLRRGEIFLQVAHDPSRPLRVVAGGKTLKALGTAFSVRLRDTDGVELMVTEGRVGIGAGERLARSSTADREAVPAVPSVGAGELALLSGDNVSIRRVNDTERRRRLGWQVGEVDFEDDTLQSVVEEFNRYNRRKLVIVDASVASLRIGGNFKAGDLDSFVLALGSILPVTVTSSESEIRLHSR